MSEKNDPIFIDYGEISIAIDNSEHLGKAPFRATYCTELDDVDHTNFTLARAFTVALNGSLDDHDWGGLCALYAHYLGNLVKYLRELWPDGGDVPKHIDATAVTYLENMTDLFKKISQPIYQDLIELELHAAAIADIKKRINEPAK